MLNKLALTAAAAVAVLGLANEAHAAEAYQDSATVGNVCATAKVSYFGDPGITPKTGYVTYVRIEVNAVGTSCASSVSWADLQLPPGAVLGTLPNAPVQCFRTVNGLRQALVSDANGGCFQQRTTVGGVSSYGWSKLDNRSSGGDRLEVYVPIWYTQAFTNRQLNAPVRNSVGDMTPGISMSVPYQAAFDSYAATNFGRGMGVQWGSWDGERVDIAFALYNFYEAGSLVIEYGTTPSFGSNLGTTPVPTGSQYYPNVTASLSGLAQNTTYYWRPKFVSSFGTFYGATQSFMTYAYLEPLPWTGPVYTCRFGRC